MLPSKGRYYLSSNLKIFDRIAATILQFSDRSEPPTGFTHSVPLTGEAYFQPAIALVAVGDAVSLSFEPDNPHDREAIRVLSAEGLTLGYLCKSGGLHDMLINQRRGYQARITSTYKGDTGNRAIILGVNLCGPSMGTHLYGQLWS